MPSTTGHRSYLAIVEASRLSYLCPPLLVVLVLALSASEDRVQS